LEIEKKLPEKCSMCGQFRVNHKHWFL
jgi:hypothetical protein